MLTSSSNQADVVDSDYALPILDDMDWTLTGASRPVAPGHPRPFVCRRHHPYQATFPPEIPYVLVQVLTKPGATVFDPFGGIGTTFFQALILERRPWTCDINTVSIDFMRQLLRLLDPQADLREALGFVQRIVEEYDPSADYCTDATGLMCIDALSEWMHPQTLNRVAFLRTIGEAAEEAPVEALLRTALSASMSSLHCQRRGMSWVADNVKPKELYERDAFGTVLRKATRLVSDILGSEASFGSRRFPELRQDALSRGAIVHTSATEAHAVPDDSVDAIVTSPPYPNFTDYVAGQRLSYYLLGEHLEPLAKNTDFAREIGARRSRGRADAFERYGETMRRALETGATKLRSGGYTCLVLPVLPDGDSSRAAAVESLVDYATGTLRFKLLRTYDRFIPPYRRHQNQTFTRLEEEMICVLRKG